MKYVVAVKQVPDTAQMSVDENGSLIRAGAPSILNPYCEYALCSILDMKGEGDEVIAFTMGPPQAEAALRRCLSLGADSAYLLTDKSFSGADVWATARTISAFIKKYAADADLFVFGRQAIDGDTGQVPYEVAQMLCAEQFAYTEELGRDGDGLFAVQNYGDVRRTCRVPGGSVVSFSGVDPNGRFMTISGYLEGSSKEIVQLDRVALGLGFYSVGLNGSMTKIIETRTSKEGRKNRKVSIDDPSKAARIIIDETEAI